jgi:hypothetical protein
MINSDGVHSSDADALRRQITKLLEAVIAKLPESFRVILCFATWRAEVSRKLRKCYRSQERP